MVFSCSTTTLLSSSNWCSRCAKCVSSFCRRSSKAFSLMRLFFLFSEDEDGPGQGESREGDTGPAEPVPVEGVKSGRTGAAVQDGNMHDFVTGAVDVTRAFEIDVVQAANRIHPAGQTIVCGANQRKAVLDRAKDGVGGMLPLRGTFAKPTVVGQVEEEIEICRNVFARQVREHVFETNENGGLKSKAWQIEDHRSFARREVPFALYHVSNEGQPPGEWHVFSEDDQLLLLIDAVDFALRGNKKAAVEPFQLCFRFGPGRRDNVISSHDEPDMVLLHEVGDRVVGVGFVTEQIGNSSLRPDEEVRLLQESFFG